MHIINNELCVKDINDKWYRRVSKYKLKPCETLDPGCIEFTPSEIVSWGSFGYGKDDDDDDDQHE